MDDDDVRYLEDKINTEVKALRAELVAANTWHMHEVAKSAGLRGAVVALLGEFGLSLYGHKTSFLAKFAEHQNAGAKAGVVSLVNSEKPMAAYDIIATQAYAAIVDDVARAAEAALAAHEVSKMSDHGKEALLRYLLDERTKVVKIQNGQPVHTPDGLKHTPTTMERSYLWDRSPVTGAGAEDHGAGSGSVVTHITATRDDSGGLVATATRQPA